MRALGPRAVVSDHLEHGCRGGGLATFDDLRAYMQQAWPRVFAAGEVELIDHSLLVTLAGSDPALKPVMLMGHMDVVPVVPGTEADWTHDPFSGHVDDTYIWGRGAIDMKDQVAGILEAVEYALAHGWQHERTLLLAFGQDEETTQYGARAHRPRARGARH
ncbi:MAG: M20/M25/M40 family metallo-hydrolase [Collinsella sp.]